MELPSAQSEVSCSVVNIKISMHMATLQNGTIGYIENPSTNVKPQRYRIIDLNTLLVNY